MRNVTGLLFFAIGAWLAYAGVAQRGRVLAARREAADRGEHPAAEPVHPSLAGLGHLVPPLIIAGLVFFGVKTTLMYVVLDAGRLFSLLDLAGLLFLLAAYGTWLVLKTRYPELATTPAAPRVAAGQGGGTGSRELADARPGGDGPGAGRRAGAGRLGAAVAAPGGAGGQTERERELA